MSGETKITFNRQPRDAEEIQMSNALCALDTTIHGDIFLHKKSRHAKFHWIHSALKNCDEIHNLGLVAQTLSIVSQFEANQDIG